MDELGVKLDDGDLVVSRDEINSLLVNVRTLVALTGSYRRDDGAVYWCVRTIHAQIEGLAQLLGVTVQP